MTVVALPTVGGAAWRWFGGAALALSIAALTVLVSIVLGMAFGFRPLIVRSGSMSPTVETGDVVLTRLVHPSDVAVGDVVTFRDPTRSGNLVTHRIVDVQPDGGRFAFVTMGDANTGEERWSIAADGRVGAMSLRIPKAGYPLALLRTAVVRSSLLLGAALILALVALRRIWG